MVRSQIQMFVAALIASSVIVAFVSALPVETTRTAQEREAEHTDDIAASVMTLDDLRWFTGDWRGTRADGSIVEESWREPIGDAMLGTFRWISPEGKTRFYELIAIEQDESGPVMRLKHFNPGLKGWEEKDECLEWALVEAEDGRAIFRRGEGDHAGDIVIERRGEDGLYIGVDVVRDGQKGRLEFEFTRYRP